MSRWFQVACVLVACAVFPARAFAQAPLLELEGGNVELGWTLSGEGKLRGTATLRNPTLRVSAGKFQRAQPGGAGERRGARPSSGLPLQADRLEIHQGAIVFLAPGATGRELLRIHDLEVGVNNYSNRKLQAGSKATVITANGKIGREGTLVLSVNADPTKSTQDFTGHAELTGLRLEELGALVDQRFAVQPVTATMKMNLAFAVRDGRINGTVTPTLSNVGLGAGDTGAVLDQLPGGIPKELGDLIPGQLGGKLPGNLGAKVPGQLGTGQGLTATIPIRGTLKNPEADLFSALAEVLAASVAEAASAKLLTLGAGVVP